MFCRRRFRIAAAAARRNDQSHAPVTARNGLRHGGRRLYILKLRVRIQRRQHGIQTHLYQFVRVDFVHERCLQVVQNDFEQLDGFDQPIGGAARVLKGGERQRDHQQTYASDGADPKGDNVSPHFLKVRSNGGDNVLDI